MSISRSSRLLHFPSPLWLCVLPWSVCLFLARELRGLLRIQRCKTVLSMPEMAISWDYHSRPWANTFCTSKHVTKSSLTYINSVIPMLIPGYLSQPTAPTKQPSWIQTSNLMVCVPRSSVSSTQILARANFIRRELSPHQSRKRRCADHHRLPQEDSGGIERTPISRVQKPQSPLLCSTGDSSQQGQ